MGCFLTGAYASRYDEAAMMGYVQSDSLLHWQEALIRAIDAKQATLQLERPQRKERTTQALSLEWSSAHRREVVGRSITICHILLDCGVEK
ncbi:hypothetical protein HQ560_10005 [bacterium]|nr:hypothetical protein [bacterium]